MDTSTSGKRFHVCEQCVNEDWMVPVEEDPWGRCECGRRSDYLVRDKDEGADDVQHV